MTPQAFSFACNGILELTLEQCKKIDPILGEKLFKNGPYHDFPHGIRNEILERVEGATSETVDKVESFIRSWHEGK